MLQSFQLQGGFAPDPHLGLCSLEPNWGSAQDPNIGSRSHAHDDRESSPPKRNILASPLPFPRSHPFKRHTVTVIGVHTLHFYCH